MKRIAANYLYINEKTLLKNGVIELDCDGIVTDFFSLDDRQSESSQTKFFNGILMQENKKEIKIGEKAILNIANHYRV